MKGKEMLFAKYGYKVLFIDENDIFNWDYKKKILNFNNNTLSKFTHLEENLPIS